MSAIAPRRGANGLFIRGFKKPKEMSSAYDPVGGRVKCKIAGPGEGKTSLTSFGNVNWHREEFNM